jgi:hypothetical protein
MNEHAARVQSRRASIPACLPRRDERRLVRFRDEDGTAAVSPLR